MRLRQLRLFQYVGEITIYILYICIIITEIKVTCRAKKNNLITPPKNRNCCNFCHVTNISTGEEDGYRTQTPISRNSCNSCNHINISTGEEDGYSKNMPFDKETTIKTRHSNKFLCPNCGGKLEIWNVKDWNGKIFGKAYVCTKCDNFFSKEECDVK